MEEVVEVVPEKALIGKQFRKDAKVLMDWLSQLDKTAIESLEVQLEGGR